STPTPTPTPMANLSVTKTDSPDPVTEGDNLTYTIMVHNAGPQTATGVTMTDVLPPDTTFVSLSTSLSIPAGPDLFESIPGGGGLGLTDTIVRRLQPPRPLPPGGGGTIPIEIVALNLVSIQPITVTYKSGRP